MLENATKQVIGRDRRGKSDNATSARKMTSNHAGTVLGVARKATLLTTVHLPQTQKTDAGRRYETAYDQWKRVSQDGKYDNQAC